MQIVRLMIITIVLLPSLSFSQNSTFTVSGTVRDLNGGAVPDAKVQVSGRIGGAAIVVTTDAGGQFIVPGLRAGSYSIRVAASGFNEATKVVDLLQDDQRGVDFQLSVANVAIDVIVEDEAARTELERVPGGTALIGRVEVQQTLASNLDDVLRFAPGVFARSRYGSDETQLSIRGSGLRNNFHARGINILINGLPYGDADGASDFETLELMTAARVEVWKGANALRYGGNTAGGAINVVTETGQTAFPLEVRLQAGSFNSLKGYVSTGGKRGRFGYFVAASDTEFGGYREHSTQGRRRLFGNIGYQIDPNTDIYGDLVYANIGEKLPGALTLDEFLNDPRRANANNVLNDWGRFINYYRGSIGAKRRFGSRHELSFNGSFQYREMAHPIFQILDQSVRTVSTEFRYAYTGLRNRFVIGFAPQATFNGERRFENLLGVQGSRTAHFDTRADNYGIYFEDQFEVTTDLTLIAGGRADFARRRFSDRLAPLESDVRNYNAFSPKIGFVWRAQEDGQIFANFSRSYEPPILTELTSFGAPGFLPLDAQDTWQFEVGSRGDVFKRRLSYEIAFFNAAVRNEVINRNVQPFPGAPFTIPSYRNVPGTRHSGVEVSADALLAKDVFDIRGELRWHTTYTFSNFKITEDPDFDSNFLPGAPRQLLRSEIRYDHPKGFWAAPNVDWSPAGYFIDSANTIRNFTYTVFNLRAGYDRRKFGIFVEAQNVADRKYSGSTQVDAGDGRYYEPSNGRSIFGGIYFRLGGR